MCAGRGKTDNYANIIEKPKLRLALTSADECKVPKRSRTYLTVYPSSKLEEGEYWIENEGDKINSNLRVSRGVIYV
jgi:hypothetical protein